MFDPTPPRPTDGFSIAALVTGLVGTGPIAFALGAVGLHRTSRDRSGGRGFAIAGLVLGGVQMAALSVAVAGFAVALVTGASTGRLIEEFGTTTGANPTTIDALETGDCFSTGDDDGAAGTAVTVDCSHRHDGEVLEVVTLPDGDYPGLASLEATAEDRCSTDASDAVDAAGLDPDDYEYGYYYPLAENWADGSHLLQCTIHGWNGELQGSVLDGDATVVP